MKLNFLPLLQMVYTCDDTIDDHICVLCDDTVEHGRIRHAALLKHSSYDAVIAAPTDPTVWQAAKDAGELIVLPDIRGTFDGGAPKTGTGYGANATKYLGADFKVTTNDPVYAANWAHYRSLVAKGSWHLVYLTETKLHVSGVPVTASPKNPITDVLTDEVTWQTDFTWSEYFTPAPFDIPADIFTCDAAAA